MRKIPVNMTSPRGGEAGEERMRVRVPGALAAAIDKAVSERAYPDRASVVVAALEDFFSRPRMIRSQKDRGLEELVAFQTLVLLSSASGRFPTGHKRAFVEIAKRLEEAGVKRPLELLEQAGYLTQIRQADEAALKQQT
jgi:Arc/MetJ-type ribon-helix-helix transcriptional regulator